MFQIVTKVKKPATNWLFKTIKVCVVKEKTQTIIKNVCTFDYSYFLFLRNTFCKTPKRQGI
jgi:hypothetical protein